MDGLGPSTGPFLTRLLRGFFYLLYHPLAWSYDLVAWMVSLGRWRSWVASVLPYLAGPRILELGHGPGHLQAELALREDLTGFGLDRSSQMGRIATRRLLKAGQRPRLLLADGRRLPYAEAAFDQVVATFPTEYILEAETLGEIARVLRPGGGLVLLPLAWITGGNWLERMAAWLFRVTGQSADWQPAFADPLRRAGFRVIEERRDLGDSEVMLLLCRREEE